MLSVGASRDEDPSILGIGLGYPVVNIQKTIEKT
jgi:hypothetical protein